MRKLKLIVLNSCFLIGLLGCNSKGLETTPINLRTEYLTNPIGIDTHSPRFTWEYDGVDIDFKVKKSEINIGTSLNEMKPISDDYEILPETKYYWNVVVWDNKGKKSQTSEIATFETGKFDSKEWNASWITDDKDKEIEEAPLFRKTYNINKKIKEARLYISAYGYYEFFINGERVGENFMDPGYTHFDKRNLYVTHDITKLFKDGNNAFAAILGNGWANEQSVATWNFHEAQWRKRPCFIAEIKVIYNDETSEIIGTDETWKTNIGGYIYNNIYSGDRYDATKEQKGWKEASFDDNDWQKVKAVSNPSPILKSQQMPGIQICEELKPIKIQKFSDKLYVFSFQKNFTGFCELKVKGTPGTHITIKHGELLKKDGRLEQGNINVYYYPVKKGEIFQTDEFTLKGDGSEEVFVPAFTYHGFQYVEVESNKPIQLTEENLTGLFIHTALKSVGNFSCSDELLNKIWDATMQAYKSNIHSIPTDCPQREKNGWTADAHVAVDLGLLGFDGITLYEKWMNDFVDNQRDNGIISPIVPSSGWGFDSKIGPVWDAAMFIIPNALYNYYGDTRSIETIYPTLEKYLKYLKTQEDNDGYITFGLGDWVFWKATTNNTYTSTSYYYLQNQLMSKFASLLGKDSTVYNNKAKELKDKINSKFYDASTGKYAEGTQAAQALALYLNIVPSGDEAKVAKVLCDSVRANDHFLDFGLIGSKTVPAMLTKYGYVEDAMKMLTKTDAPSWGYWMKEGLTTLPETWVMSPQFKDASLNHVFLGDVSAWMMNQLAGINYDTQSPGFQNILITPHFVNDIQWAKGEYHSVKGLIKSEWKKEGNEVKLNVEIPGGCTATVLVDGKSQQLGGGKHLLNYPLN